MTSPEMLTREQAVMLRNEYDKRTISADSVFPDVIDSLLAVMDERAKIEAEYREVTGRLRECVARHQLGLGGEKLDALVCDALDARTTENAVLREDAHLAAVEIERLTALLSSPGRATESSSGASAGEPRSDSADADTERLDWLAGYPSSEIAIRWEAAMREFRRVYPNGGILDAAARRAAIDAAMSRVREAAGRVEGTNNV